MPESKTDRCWSDSHCHLNLPEFSADLPAVLSRAASAGVRRILVPGIDLATSETAVKMAEENEAIFFACGIHPNSAADFEASMMEPLRTMAKHPKCVAIGEIGLDAYRDSCPIETQITALKAHLELAEETSLPVILHCRRAFDRMSPLINDAVRRSSGRIRGVFHAFDESVNELEQVLALDFMIGIGGSVTYKSSRRSAVVRSVPPDRFLLETDAPYLTPVSLRGNRNEPGNIPLIGASVAALKEISEAEVMEKAYENALRLFPQFGCGVS